MTYFPCYSLLLLITFIGKKDMMISKDFWLTQIGQSTMETSYGFHLLHFLNWYEAYVFSVIYEFLYWCFVLVGSDYHLSIDPLISIEPFTIHDFSSCQLENGPIVNLLWDHECLKTSCLIRITGLSFLDFPCNVHFFKW